MLKSFDFANLYFLYTVNRGFNWISSGTALTSFVVVFQLRFQPEYFRTEDVTPGCNKMILMLNVLFAEPRHSQYYHWMAEGLRNLLMRMHR